MARVAEIPVGITGGNATKLQIQRFAELVAAHEREACAEICDPGEVGEYGRSSDYRQGLYDGAENCAAAIRARGDA